MKNALLLTALLAVSATASAGFSENGQAAASQNAVTRVSALRSVPDDSYVTLEGYIERQVRRRMARPERYPARQSAPRSRNRPRMAPHRSRRKIRYPHPVSKEAT